MSTSSISSTSSNALRITGMATGMDTDATVKQMLAGENAKLDKLKQNREYNEWRQEALRDIIKDFRGLRDNYLLSSSPSSTNMIKSLNYSGATVTPSSDGVTATALPGAATGASTVKVNQIAKSAKLVGDGLNTTSTKGTGDVFTASDWNGKKITLNVDNTDYTVTLGNVTGGAESNLATAINEAIKTAVNSTGDTTDLSSKITASVDAITHKLAFNSTGGSAIKVSSSDISANVKDFANISIINPTTSSTLGDLGFTGSSTFTIKLGTSNSYSVTLSSTDTIASAMTKINDAQLSTSSSTKLYSSVKVSFSELTKSLAIETRDMGSSKAIEISGDSANLAKLGFTTATAGTTTVSGTGQDAIVEITPPGSTTATTVTKTSNSFTIDNITYNLIKDPGTSPYTVNLTTKADGQSSVDKIKSFIEKYNALVEKISTKLTEKKNYDYKPLTDSQKEDMEDDDIEAWETKAKKGMLRNDGELQNILYNMRTAFTSGVTAAGLTLEEIGLDTYSGSEAITKPGQIRIKDEAKLKTSLEERGDQVMKLFTASEPTTVPVGTVDEDKYKYDNTGILQRIEDIINNVAGKSDGILLQRAGYENTASELTNTLTKQLKAQDKAIDEMMDKIYDKQERYYQMFAKLESAMNTLNSQQSWLTQSLSG